MLDVLIKKLAGDLIKRSLADGGFRENPDGDFRPDTTAWAIMSLLASGLDEAAATMGRQRLATSQNKDGSVSITADHPEVSWPTALAILAWQGAVEQQRPQTLAIDYLLGQFGTHGPRQQDSPLGHDTSIPGWPWVNGTHSWVEPTALGLLALSVSGYAGHLRARKAAMLLRDRQLGSGGWNYGNTSVFQQELHPMPAPTGLALQALAGHANKEDVAHSLAWLETVIDGVRTPLSLALGLLGLGAWGKRPRHAMNLIAASVKRQDLFGNYPTTCLSLLLLAIKAESGLSSLMADRKEQHLG